MRSIPKIGGVLIRGERGTAKSTAARALSALLPKVKTVSDCRFGCDPESPNFWCTECQERHEAGEKLPIKIRPTAFINLPVSATEDRVVGTLDIEKAIQKGERKFDPGVLAAANRGLLYIDEVNFWMITLWTCFLDSAAMGMNIVEREGISFVHPARFILVGTMNPEEGDLRPQLLDRFALSVEIHGILDSRERVSIMERNIAFETDPQSFISEWIDKERDLSEQIESGPKIGPGGTTYQSRPCHHCFFDSITRCGWSSARSGYLKNSQSTGCFGRTKCDNEFDIARAAELALPHRMKRSPFEKEVATWKNLPIELSN